MHIAIMSIEAALGDHQEYVGDAVPENRLIYVLFAPNLA